MANVLKKNLITTLFLSSLIACGSGDGRGNDSVTIDDIDNDSIPDQTDNCMNIANPDQSDLDGNGQGDSCDDDMDGDGVNNAADAFPKDSTESVDVDGDGIGDNKDLDLNRTQRNSAYIETLMEKGRAMRIVAPQDKYSGDIGDNIVNVGDVNDDGFDDLLIGFDQYKINGYSAGIAYLIFGRAQGLPQEIKLAEIEQSDLDYVTFEAEGEVSSPLGIGAGMQALGDFNGDGIDDFSLSASYVPTDTGDKSGGEAYVVFGRKAWPDAKITRSLLQTEYAVGFKSQRQYGLLGIKGLVNAGDLNGDDKPDLLVSEGMSGRGEEIPIARTHIIFGGEHIAVSTDGSPAITNIDDLPSQKHTVINGLGNNGFRLIKPINIDDFNGDGISDFAIISTSYGATEPYGDDGSGAVSIVFGGRTDWPTEMNAADLTHPYGLTIFGDGIGLEFGLGFTSGDFNADGLSDLVISAPEADGSDFSKKIYILWGGDGEWPSAINSSDIATTYGTVITSDVGFGLGYSLDTLEDTNGDDTSELLIAAYYSFEEGDISNHHEAGRLFKVNSRNNWNDIVLSYVDLPNDVDQIGMTTWRSRVTNVRALGDYNNDGYQEMLLDPNLFYKDTEFGEAYIIYGYQDILEKPISGQE